MVLYRYKCDTFGPVPSFKISLVRWFKIDYSNLVLAWLPDGPKMILITKKVLSHALCLGSRMNSVGAVDQLILTPLLQLLLLFIHNYFVMSFMNFQKKMWWKRIYLGHLTNKTNLFGRNFCYTFTGLKNSLLGYKTFPGFLILLLGYKTFTGFKNSYWDRKIFTGMIIFSPSLNIRLRTLCSEFKDSFSTSLPPEPAKLPPFSTDVPLADWEVPQNRLLPRVQSPVKKIEIKKQLVSLL